jgi:DNA polymerase-3 subunit delta
MQIAAAHLQEQLAKGLRSIYALHSDEPLLQQEAADLIRQTARDQGYTERHVFTVAGAHFDWESVLAAAGAMSLFSDKLLLDLRIPSGKPGKEGSVALQALAERMADQQDVLLLVLLPRLDKTAKSSGWFMALDHHGATVQIDPIERA